MKSTRRKRAKSHSRPIPSTARIGTIAYYGPDIHTATKVVVAVFRSSGSKVIVMRKWYGEGVDKDPEVQLEIQAFLTNHHVTNVAVSDGIIGCPHEEGIDYPLDRECPFCQFWATGTRTHD
ncbi:MAG: hypothetical protein M1596_06600 [Firmicutes bacterium]|nr:hypothetical protein [Bacillota bacterium]